MAIELGGRDCKQLNPLLTSAKSGPWPDMLARPYFTFTLRKNFGGAPIGTIIAFALPSVVR